MDSLDEQEFRDELSQQMLPSFPFQFVSCVGAQDWSDRQKMDFIWNRMQSFLNNTHDPGRLPQEVHNVDAHCLQMLFDSIKQSDFKTARSKYKEQCSTMWEKGEMQTDNGMIFALAVGEKHRAFPILQFLVDDYLCCKAECRENKGMSV